MGKTGRLNLEMRDWMQHQNKKMGSFGDKEILKSFEQAEKDTGTLPLNPAPADEFDKIWSRIQAERKSASESSEATPVSKPQRRRSWKKMIVVGVAAAILTVGGAFAAMGTKSYFYRDGRRVSNGVVYNNDSGALTVRDEEEAYEKVAQELGVRTLQLGYMPEGMYFQSLIEGSGYGKLVYEYKDNRVFFVQEKSNSRTSLIYSSDTKDNYKIWNPGLRLEIEICVEKNPTQGDRYEAQFVSNGVYYYLSGIMDQNDFEEMVRKIDT